MITDLTPQVDYKGLFQQSIAKFPNSKKWLNGCFCAIKTAQFNHFRTHRAYDAAICLGVSPNELYIDVISKAELMEKPLVSMEKGANASYKWTRHPKELHKITSFKALIENFTSEFLEIKKLAEVSRLKRDKIDLA